MRKILNRRHARIEPGFNLTPMLDMIFYLLFFFIMATKFRDDAAQRMQVRLPSAKSAATTPTEAAPALTITADGKLYLDNRALAPGEMEMELHNLAVKRQSRIVIRGDERVDYGRVVQVMDMVKQAGIKDMDLDLGKPAAKPTPAGS